MMEQLPERTDISDAEMASVVAAIKTRYGIDFSGYEKKSLKRGLARLMMRNNMQSIMDLWATFLKDKTMLVHYIDELLVNLTEFFRNPEVWIKLKDDLLVQLAGNPQIDIWHAGCSTGEEVYSDAILLKERFLLHKTRILATDLSSRALSKASEGRYSNMVWKKLLSSYLDYNPEGNPDKYFMQEEDEFVAVQQLKNIVEFQRSNLVQDTIDREFDIVFCRNVMIYFDDVLKMKTLEKIHKQLKPKGFFIIGYYDMLPEESKNLFKLYCPTTRIYTKR